MNTPAAADCRPDVTVITICYNAAETLAATLDSVLGQTARDRMEVIVIDGASTDGTADILQRYADRIDRLVSEPDKGIYNAMNKGLALSTGRYINFMNAGDRFFNADVVSDFIKAVEAMEKRPDVVYGATVRETPRGCYGDMPALRVMPAALGACHQSIFADGELLRRERFDETYCITADFELFHRLYMKGARFVELNKYVAIYDTFGLSSDPRTARRRYAERCRITGRRDTELGYRLTTLRINLGARRRRFIDTLRRLAGRGNPALRLRPLSAFTQLP